MKLRWQPIETASCPYAPGFREFAIDELLPGPSPSNMGRERSARGSGHLPLLVAVLALLWAGWSQFELERRLATVEAQMAASSQRGLEFGREVSAGDPLDVVLADPNLSEPKLGEPQLAEPAVPSDYDGLMERLAALELRFDQRPSQAEDEAHSAAKLSRARALNRAIARADIGEVQRLLALGVDLEARDDDRQTPLSAAAISGDGELLDLLVNAGADLERTAGRRSMTPLLAALDAVQEQAALRLLDLGAEPEAVDKNGESALIWASFNGCEDVTRRLLDLGVRIDFRAHDGTTALLQAVERGRTAIVRLLLEHGADPNVTSESGKTALVEARAQGDAGLERLLMSHGAR